VTSRTFQSRLLLRPLEILNIIILGILGRAVEKYPLEIHAFTFMSNHYHLLLTVLSNLVLSEFMNHVNSKLAKEAGEIHDWHAKLWGRRYQAIPILDDDALVGRLRYIMSHGCKEGLVADPEEWPGVTSLPALVHGKTLRGTWHNRTGEYRAKRRRKVIPPSDFTTNYEVPVSPIPCWSHLSPEEHQARCQSLLDEIKQETRETIQRTGRQPLGREWVLSQDPHSLPEKTKRSPAPLCHTTSPALHEQYVTQYRAFLESYREASTRFRAGELDVQFPPHSFPPPGPFVPAELDAPTGHPPRRTNAPMTIGAGDRTDRVDRSYTLYFSSG